MSILVCYLVAPGRIYTDRALDFALSYSEHPAGIDHDLLIVQKDDALLPSGQWAKQAQSVEYESHSNLGYDIRSLQTVCQEYTNYDFICWLGSWSLILSNDWLSKLYNAAIGPGVGAVGVTGSYEAGIHRQAPNPHLRSNILMLSPLTLNSLGFGLADTRVDCFHFEHGPDSLYYRLQAHGLKCVVVGDNGYSYNSDEWANSHTYRCGEQHNLLISDKHTEMYAAASADKRKELRLMAGWDC